MNYSEYKALQALLFFSLPVIWCIWQLIAGIDLLARPTTLRARRVWRKSRLPSPVISTKVSNERNALRERYGKEQPLDFRLRC